jgi:hypothetical protein
MVRILGRSAISNCETMTHVEKLKSFQKRLQCSELTARQAFDNYLATLEVE